MTPSVAPVVLDGWMRPFRCHFTAAAWRHVLVLVGYRLTLTLDGWWRT